jgi:RNA-directed DNA polymerase
MRHLVLAAIVAVGFRRHMGRAQNRKGFGWKQWSRQWIYQSLRLFNGYRVRRPMLKVAPAR